MGAECYNVEITPEAESDLRGIYRYIADEKENPPAAFRLVSLIYGEIAKLDTMPERFPIWRNEPWKSRGVRSMEVENYHVFYLVEETPPRVIALRVFYNSRNV